VLCVADDARRAARLLEEGTQHGVRRGVSEAQKRHAALVQLVDEGDEAPRLLGDRNGAQSLPRQTR
jgi:hypothetical protein